MCVIKMLNWKDARKMVKNVPCRNDDEARVRDEMTETLDRMLWDIKQIIWKINVTPFYHDISETVGLYESVMKMTGKVEKYLDKNSEVLPDIIHKINKSEAHFECMTRLYLNRICERYNIRSERDTISSYQVDEIIERAEEYIDDLITDTPDIIKL